MPATLPPERLAAPLHVLLVSDHETQGGAAVATSRLATALCEAGYRVTRLVAYPDQQPHPWATLPLALPRSFGMKLAHRLTAPTGQEWWLRERIARQFSDTLASLRPDVINLNNLHGALGGGWSLTLARLSAQQAPTVWTLHDMWSFSGRCAYSYDCRRFITGCDAACPTPDEYPALAPARIAAAWKARRDLFTSTPLTCVAPSRWLAEEARAGLWRNHPIEVIPNSLSLDLYRPLPRALAREALNIRHEGPLLLMVAQHLHERRKGGELLLQTLRQLSDRPFTLLTLGHGTLTQEEVGHPSHALGYIEDELTKALVYSAADLLIHPAPVDNLPNVVLEALACGTPVVGFPIGGMPDMVRPGISGWLAPTLTAEALSDTLNEALDTLAAGTDLRTSSRHLAEQEYAPSHQAQRYGALFQRLLTARPRSQTAHPSPFTH